MPESVSEWVSPLQSSRVPSSRPFSPSSTRDLPLATYSCYDTHPTKESADISFSKKLNLIGHATDFAALGSVRGKYRGWIDMINEQ